MRILFTTHPAYGHFHPLLPVAEVARAAGHEVAFAVSDRFRPVIERLGFSVMAAGLNWLESDHSSIPEELRPPPDCSLEVFFAQQFLSVTAPPLARDVVMASESWMPDIIVRERTEFGGALASDILGVPCVAVQVASPSLMTPEMLAAMAEPYNAARAGLGLPADPGLAALEGQTVLVFAPPSLHDPAVPLPPNLVSLRPASADRTAEPNLPAWAEALGRERPLVYATLGTVFNDPTYELPFFPSVIEALAEEPVDVVITVGPDVDPSYLGTPPANVRVERYVPQSLLFPHCSAVVCHGGYGTLLTAIEHSVPLVVVPYGADQPINARSVERLGIGRVVPEDDVDADRMRAAIRSVIDDPRWRVAMEGIRVEMDSLPPAARAVVLLEGLVDRPGEIGPAA